MLIPLHDNSYLRSGWSFKLLHAQFMWTVKGVEKDLNYICWWRTRRFAQKSKNRASWKKIERWSDKLRKFKYSRKYHKTSDTFVIILRRDIVLSEKCKMSAFWAALRLSCNFYFKIKLKKIWGIECTFYTLSPFFPHFLCYLTSILLFYIKLCKFFYHMYLAEYKKLFKINSKSIQNFFKTNIFLS